MNRRNIIFIGRISCGVVVLCLLALASGCTCLSNLTFQKERLQQYHDSGKYETDVQKAINQAAAYIRVRTKSHNQNLAIVLDIDETSLTDWEYIINYDFGWEKTSFSNWVEQASAKPIKPTLGLYHLVKSLGVKVIFITGRTQNFESSTLKNLKQAGYDNFDGIYFRPITDNSPSVSVFKGSIRRQIFNEGLKIIANIGDQDSDLKGGYAERTFKLPDPYYYSP